MIKVKDIDVLVSMMAHKAHPNLIALVDWVARQEVPIVITCAYEARGYSSVHATKPYRGLDIRTREGTINDPEAVCAMINERWIYDPERPGYRCAIYHDVGLGEHIHLQVHDRTEFV